MIKRSIRITVKLYGTKENMKVEKVNKNGSINKKIIRKLLGMTIKSYQVEIRCLSSKIWALKQTL